MRTVPITRGKFVIVDDDDYERVSALSWQASPARQTTEKWYAKRKSRGGRTLYLHRFITGAAAGTVVDHRNGDGLDCRKSNLRVGDYTLNAINRRYESSTGFRGVHAYRGGFRARVQCGPARWKGPKRLTAEAAARDYDAGALRMHGVVATLNFPMTPPPERTASSDGEELVHEGGLQDTVNSSKGEGL